MVAIASIPVAAILALVAAVNPVIGAAVILVVLTLVFFVCPDAP